MIRRWILFGLAGIVLCSGLTALEIKNGIRVAAAASIGTGKGFWDWYGPEAESERFLLPFPTGTLLFHLETTGAWALETGITFSQNSCGLDINGTDYIYRQSSAELPVAFKSYFSKKKPRFFMKGGANLIYLTGPASFNSTDGSVQLLVTENPKNPFHKGFLTGLGIEAAAKNSALWVLDLTYQTFYTSPDYKRTDGTIADIRFHRFELGLGYLF